MAEAAGHFEVDILSVGKAFSDDPNGPCCTKGIINQAKSSSNSAHTPSLENNTLVKPSSQCSGICRPYFRMCFKQFQRSIILNGDCMYGQGFSPVLRLPYISPRNSQLGSTTPTPFSSINDIPFVSVNLPFDFTWMVRATRLMGNYRMVFTRFSLCSICRGFLRWFREECQYFSPIVAV